MLRAGQFARADEFGRLVWLGGGSRTAKKRADTFQEQNSRSAQQCDRCEDVDWWVGEGVAVKRLCKAAGRDFGSGLI